ncbi:MAG: DNA-3-methyladenine glycosylase [Gaiellaceae bacterium]
MSDLGRSFFERDVRLVARELVGVTLLVDGVGGVVVETEAYAADDPASHSYCGRTARNATMFGPAGHLYVYRSYGVHWCANAVCEADGVGAAVLLRALEPTAGLEEMRERRGLEDERLLCAGPGRLTQALGITGDHDGLPFDRPPFRLLPAAAPAATEATARVGITRAGDRLWRYVLAGSSFPSRPRPRGER